LWIFQNNYRFFTGLARVKKSNNFDMFPEQNQNYLMGHGRRHLGGKMQLSEIKTKIS
jgi:hypothetical protein